MAKGRICAKIIYRKVSKNTYVVYDYIICSIIIEGVKKMKKFFASALLVAGVLTSSNCFAALDYSYNRAEKIFTVKSEEIIPLEDGANELTVAFTKEYDFSN